MRISQCSMPLSRSRPMSGVTGLSDAPGPLASTSACTNFVCGNSQRRPLYLARFTHRDETSTPSNWRSETRVELRKRPSNKSGIQPVPVQRSRMRNRWGRAREAWRRSARKVMDAAVSCLKKKVSTGLVRVRLDAQTHLGMSMPGRQAISRSPKNSVPRMYCSGRPAARCRTRARRREGHAPGASVKACSRSHRSSLRAEARSRQARSSGGSRRSASRARRSR